MVESLARAEATRHAVAIVSPLEVHSGAGVTWMPLTVPGNLHLVALWRLRRLVASFAGDIVVLHAGSPGEGALAAALLAAEVPTVVVEHAPEHFPLRRPRLDRVYAVLKRRAARWLAVSATGARRLEEMWRLDEGTIGTIYCGVDAPRLTRSSPPASVVGFGRPTASKGYDVFRAVAGALAPELPMLAWRWVGGTEGGSDGPVVIVPWSDTVGNELAAATLVLVPSRVEGVPLVLLEAWSLRRAVVASRVGGIPEVAGDGRCAVLVEPGDVPTWTEAVRLLLAEDRERAALGEEGYRRWRQRFTVAAMAARFESLFAGLRQRAGEQPCG